MAWPSPPSPNIGSRQRLASALRPHALQVAIGLGVFVLFMVVASGNLELGMRLGLGSSSLAAVAATPEFAVLVAVSLTLVLLLPLLTPIAGSLLTFLAMMPVYWVGYATVRPALIPMEFSLLTILLLFAVHVLVSYFRESHHKQRVIDVFGQYVPPALAHRISTDPRACDLQGEARELSILFCDVRDFTRHAEHLRPRELTALLNALFTPLTEIVHRHHGTIDKYIGDAVMAFWGAPLEDRHHAGNAVSAAFEMQLAAQRLAGEFAGRGWPALSLGVGINTGVVFVGNMGSRFRMAYTAIGDAVNLAARLETLTRLFNSPVIVGEATRRAFPAASYRELGLVEVKGKQELVRIFEPLPPGLDPAATVHARLGRHNAALTCYYARDWDGAERGFRALDRENPHDPVYGYYLERIAEFRRAPPPGNWRGELRFTVS